MIIKSGQANRVKADQPYGGRGHMDAQFYFNPDRPIDGSRFSMGAQIVLPVGASVGYHTHPDDEEIYLVVSGTGTYVENDRSPHPVGQGDLTHCPRGEGHGLDNTGPEPLVFVAFIAQ
ncbi:MAG: cupin domain-containing protein [Deltaproteobacteria bacterium]|jgi:quercetin dioxygenase-like cupin family protein|nr:cupin domain-containing protein [Deltaproteobacteria bacterium]